MSDIKVGVLRSVPKPAYGFVRDLRIRWALEELQLPYDEQLLDWEETETPEFLRLHPFGQVPIYQEGDLRLFESGAILLHIAEKSETLMPTNPVGRARVHAWMFAALNSIEPYMMNMVDIDRWSSKEQWAILHRPKALEVVQDRLIDLSNWLSGKDYLEDRFTVADLLMTTVLRISKLFREDVVAQMPVLNAYRQRCEARPGYKRALDAQVATFAKHPWIG
jgi:glutathione S-transferase